MSFTSVGVPADLAAHLASRGIESPYPVQAATLPDALEGLDVCAQSPTGSGKTLAFGIPLVSRVGRGRPKSPAALVLAPTRELASQIATELEGLAAVRNRRVATFYGGVGFPKQINALRQGVDIAVACPGRLLDLLQQGSLRLDNVAFVVIDEADRMADMGFLPPVREILAKTSEARQTLLFSATLGGDVEHLIRGFQRSPKRHVLDAPSDEVGSRTHRFLRTPAGDRAAATARIVAGHYSSIVFCRTKRGVDRLARQLEASGISTVALHGDRSQAQRDRALAAFHARRAQVLVGTDVAARGIHVDDVGCVVHFDPPEDESTYLHRSGRTGRAGATGLVVSLVTSEQEHASRKLQQSLGLPVTFDGPGHEAGQFHPGAVGATSAATSPSRGGRGPGARGDGGRARSGGPTGTRNDAGRRGYGRPDGARSGDERRPRPVATTADRSGATTPRRSDFPDRGPRAGSTSGGARRRPVAQSRDGRPSTQSGRPKRPRRGSTAA